MNVGEFTKRHFRHFNAAVVVDATEGWSALLENGGKMLVTLGGAMSTAELGISLAEMIRQDKVHAICCTGANLEEDLFNLVAHEHYRRIPHYRDLTAAEDAELYHANLNRVTDGGSPEEGAMNRVGGHLLEGWRKAEQEGGRFFPHEYMYQLIESGVLDAHHQIDPRNSWVVAAAQKNLPMWVPGWEDSSMGNFLVSQVIKGELSNTNVVKSGLEAMQDLVGWYEEIRAKHPLGFFQIGGGIAGDFPICVVPLINRDLRGSAPCWSYFCQISDSTTSFGSYSGAVPNEKISWGKLQVDTPRFVIESDATIVAPLIFASLLGW